jgi:hypothetical protein
MKFGIIITLLTIYEWLKDCSYSPSGNEYFEGIEFGGFP